MNARLIEGFMQVPGQERHKSHSFASIRLRAGIPLRPPCSGYVGMFLCSLDEQDWYHFGEPT